MGDVNAKYSSGKVTPEQQGTFAGPPKRFTTMDIVGGVVNQGQDSTAMNAWEPPDTMENAHDLGDRPGYPGGISTNATNRLTPAPSQDNTPD